MPEALKIVLVVLLVIAGFGLISLTQWTTWKARPSKFLARRQGKRPLDY